MSPIEISPDELLTPRNSTKDWPTIAIREIGNLYGGLASKSAEDFSNGDAKYVTFLNVFNNVVIDPNIVGQVRVNSGELQNRVHKGDILFNATSETPSELAMAAVVDFELDHLYLNSFCFGLRLTRPDLLDPLFLAYLFRSWVGRERMASLAQGATRYNLSKAQFRTVSIPCPPLAEQRVIAEVLSDVDALIDALDELIAKKRSIKQGAMQLLLSGKQRLPGFEEEWKKKQWNEFAPLQRGFDLPNHMLVSGHYPVVYSNGIMNHHIVPMVQGPGVVTGRSGTIGNVTFVSGDFWPHNTSLWVTDFKGNDHKFVYYSLIHAKLENLGGGSGVPTLNRNDVHSRSIIVPDSVEEQRAIATSLTDMDAEIDALIGRREKTKLIKLGMMQELLTGRTRLV